MQSGQGGIRWNSVTNYIQLMDENKNWVNYKYYVPDRTIERIYFSNNSSGAVTINLVKHGLYCCTYLGTYSAATNLINSTGQIKNNFYQNGSSNSGGYQEVIIYSEGNSSVTIASGTTWKSVSSVIYMGEYSNITSADRYFYQNDTSTRTIDFINRQTFIHFCTCGANSYTKSFNTSEDIPDKDITISTGSGNMYSAACINYNGTVTCSGIAGPYQSSVGCLLATSYSII